MASLAHTSSSDLSSFQWDGQEIQFRTGTSIVETVKSSIPQPSLRDMIALEIGAVPEVDAVFTKMQGRVLHVWTVLRGATRDSRRSVYARERVLIDMNEHLAFDFNVINGNGENPRCIFAEESLDLAFIRE